MRYGLQVGGPFHGTLCVKWSGAEEPPTSFTQGGFVERLQELTEQYKLAPVKRHLVFEAFHNDAFKFDVIAPLVRLARMNGWSCGLVTKSTALPSCASEFSYVLAWHWGKDDWLRFPCAGLVMLEGAEIPTFDEKTAAIPKYFLVQSISQESVGLIASWPMPWTLQESLPEVTL
jgi:hypothetical protein